MLTETLNFDGGCCAPSLDLMVSLPAPSRRPSVRYAAVRPNAPNKERRLLLLLLSWTNVSIYQRITSRVTERLGPFVWDEDGNVCAAAVTRSIFCIRRRSMRTAGYRTEEFRPRNAKRATPAQREEIQNYRNY